MRRERPALYTTVHAGVREYLAAWYASVRAQSCRDFDLWISVEGMSVAEVKTAAQADVAAEWVLAVPGMSPAEIRQQALARLVEQYETVIFVDGDDVLDPSRVATARQALQESDVAACAMRLIDATGQALDSVFCLPRDAPITELIPRANVFGLTNSAYRSDVLRRCLPIPADCRLVDWYLATRAWALGASMTFDATCRMEYRLHSASMAPIRPPFTADQILSATKNAMHHHQGILASGMGLPCECQKKLSTARAEVGAFLAMIEHSPEILAQYIVALNDLPPDHVWWSCVAHPRLRSMWYQQLTEFGTAPWAAVCGSPAPEGR